MLPYEDVQEEVLCVEYLLVPYIQYNGELIPPNEHYSNKKLLLLFSECNSHFGDILTSFFTDIKTTNVPF